jgi:hypothetical protein
MAHRRPARTPQPGNCDPDLLATWVVKDEMDLVINLPRASESSHQ